VKRRLKSPISKRALVLLIIFFSPLVIYLHHQNKSDLTYAQLLTSSSPQVFLPGPLNLLDPNKAVLGITEKVDPNEVVRLVNIERQKVNSLQLIKSSVLTKAAQMRAEVMLRTQNMSHIDPYENIQLNTVLPKLGYSYIYASENIALASGNAAGFVAGWMNSPSHKYNLLDPILKETGVGVVDGKFGNYYVTIVVQIFAVPQQISENISDQEKIGEILTGISHQQEITRQFIKDNPQNTYYQNWQKLFQLQKDILLTLTDKLEDQKDQKAIYNLIFQYNKNWQNSPKIN